jgi:hypothetical protein
LVITQSKLCHAHSTVKVVARLDEGYSKAVEHAGGGPQLHRAVHAAVVAKLRRQCGPLAAGVQVQDDPVQRRPRVDLRPVPLVRRVELGQHVR